MGKGVKKRVIKLSREESEQLLKDVVKLWDGLRVKCRNSTSYRVSADRLIKYLNQ